MFVLCPHCQFLVTVDPVSGQPPAHCPSCHGAMAPPATTPPVTDASAVSPDPGEDDEGPPSAQSKQEAAPIQFEPLIGPTEVGTDDDAVGTPIDRVDTDASDTGNSDATAQDPSTGVSADPLRTPVTGPAAAGARWRMPVAIGGLTLLLGLQMLLSDRAQLASDARWRPTLETICAAARCMLPAWREPAAFTLLDRDVRSDPRRPGVLHVSARFRNDARWPQSRPQVLLTLSDVDGRVAGARLFLPREYGASALTQKPIASGQVADIAMDVVEPAPDIVAFTFDFR